MNAEFGTEPFPRGPLIAAGVLVAASIALAALGSVARIGRTELPPGTPVASYDMRFTAQPDGTLQVTTPDGRALAVLPVGKDGFIRGVLHSIDRERRRASAPADAPLRVTRFTDGRIALIDPATGQRFDIDVFGPTNAGSFARLWYASDDLHAGRHAAATPADSR